jgi:hypothetical protein
MTAPEGTDKTKITSTGPRRSPAGRWNGLPSP